MTFERNYFKYHELQNQILDLQNQIQTQQHSTLRTSDDFCAHTALASMVLLFLLFALCSD